MAETISRDLSDCRSFYRSSLTGGDEAECDFSHNVSVVCAKLRTMTSRPILFRRAIAVMAAILAVGLIVLAADRWARGRADATADAAASAAARGHAALLASELQKFRLLPLVLVEYPDVADALSGDDAAARRLDATFELLAQRTDAANIYAIDAGGRTVAASNWRLPTSVVDRNYGFRPYFRDAMERGGSELFALGTISGRPGLYLARRVMRAGRPAGVVVVKVEFDAVEQAWARSSGASFVVDPHGVILITSLNER